MSSIRRTNRRKKPRRRKATQSAPAADRVQSDKLAKFLATPKTCEQVAAAFRLRNGDRKNIRALPVPAGMAIFAVKNREGVMHYVCVAQKPATATEKREWTIRYEAGGQPYIQIQFPADLPHRRIKLVPLSDVHYGARACSKNRFKEYIEFIRTNPDVYTFLNGDIMENAIDGSIGGAVYESELTPSEQVWGQRDGTEPGLIELLRPIAHKILWALPGNHEWRTWKKTNIDPLRIICSELGIPYYDEPIFIDLLVWGHRFMIHCQHGHTGSNTKGGKLNAALRPSEYQEACDFLVMGHVHDSMANPVDRIVRERTFDENGKLIGFRLVKRPQHTVICPSFHGYFGTYGARAGYAPGSWGSVALTVYRDGNYRASE